MIWGLREQENAWDILGRGGLSMNWLMHWIRLLNTDDKCYHNCGELCWSGWGATPELKTKQQNFIKNCYYHYYRYTHIPQIDLRPSK